MSRRSLTRRTALKSAGVALGGVVLLLSEDEARATSAGRAIGGFLVAIEPPDAIYLQSSEGRKRIRFLADATFARDGPAKLADFAAGDWVVVELLRPGDPQSALHLTVLYKLLEGAVTRVTDDYLGTTAGEVRLGAGTVAYSGNRLAEIPVSRISIGADVKILTRWDAASQQRLARHISVE